MGPGTDGCCIGTQTFSTNFAEIGLLHEPGSTSASAAAAQPLGSRSETDMVGTPASALARAIS